MIELEFFTAGASGPGKAAAAARRAEASGWTGLTFYDSQNLAVDPYVAMTVAAGVTRTLRLATGVTNPVTRHPAVAATAVASVHHESGGRAELGIGRGDSALAHVGLAPAPVGDFADYLTMLRSYLHGRPVPIEAAAGARTHRIGSDLPLKDAPAESSIHWLPPSRELPSVPVFVVASGPKVIRLAARASDRVMLAVGADPQRVQWGLEIARSANPEVKVGAYVPVVVDADIDRGIKEAAGIITSMARFSAMHGTAHGPLTEATRSTLEGLTQDYQMSQHGHSANVAAQRAPALAEHFAIVGPSTHCCDRLLELAELGIDRFHIAGLALDAEKAAAADATRLFEQNVLEALVSTH